MGSFNRDNRSGGDRGGNRFGKPSFGGKSFGGGRRFDNDRGDRKFGGGGFGKPQMHDAICSQCGKPCQVPFRPTGDREVFCSNCFKDKKHDGPMRPSGSSFGKPNYESRPHFDKKPSFGGGNDQYKQQFEMLNNKLDKILKALSAPVAITIADDEEKQAPETKKSKEAPAKTKPAAKKAATKKKK